MPSRLVWLCALASTFGAQAHAQPWTPIPFTPQASTVAPFGYGTVAQIFEPTGATSGTAVCAQLEDTPHCLSVSGGRSCGGTVLAGQLVSCGVVSKTVDETLFAPVDCYGHGEGDGGASGLLGPTDWCLIANYMPQRKKDTLYLYDDYVRLGQNRRFGGAVFELYGTDKLDRILQNPGGGAQLSLWAFTPGYAPASYTRAYFAIPAAQSSCSTASYTTAAACSVANGGGSCQLGVAHQPSPINCSSVFANGENGAAAGAPMNPIQGIARDGVWGASSGAVDSVTSPATGVLLMSKTAPANFTRTDEVTNLHWNIRAQVHGPYAHLTYRMWNLQSKVVDTDFQEIPAIFLHQGLGAHVYYYAGDKPYQDVDGQVSTVAPQAGVTAALQLPSRPGPFGTGAADIMTEDWVSACDVTQTQCITVASFSSTVQDLIVGPNPNSSYFGLHGFFSLTDKLDRTVSVFLFPYRFDQVVGGKSVRHWIYDLSKNANLHR